MEGGAQGVDRVFGGKGNFLSRVYCENFEAIRKGNRQYL